VLSWLPVCRVQCGDDLAQRLLKIRLFENCGILQGSGLQDADDHVDHRVGIDLILFIVAPPVTSDRLQVCPRNSAISLRSNDPPILPVMVITNANWRRVPRSEAYERIGALSITLPGSSLFSGCRSISASPMRFAVRQRDEDGIPVGEVLVEHPARDTSALSGSAASIPMSSSRPPSRYRLRRTLGGLSMTSLDALVYL
jgi:hypothetical protein